MLKLIPTRDQWRHWSLPSRLTAVGALFGALGFLAFIVDSCFTHLASRRAAPKTITRDDMPCRWAWIYLGRYSHQGARYETPAAFKYEQDNGPRSAFPQPGDQIVLTAPRALIIKGYGSTPDPDSKCDLMLEPPWGYAPKTDSEYKAGELPANSQVLVNLMQFMPSETSEPTYVWAFVGPPN